MVKKLLWVGLFFSCAFALTASAQEASNQDSLEEIIIDNNVKKTSESYTHPSCENSRIVENVVLKIKEYYDREEARNIKETREQLLLQKNIDSFEEVDITSFAPSKNYAVADAILLNKINHGIQDSQMRLCHIKNKFVKKDLYLLMLPHEGRSLIKILNFMPNQNEDEFSFVY